MAQAGHRNNSPLLVFLFVILGASGCSHNRSTQTDIDNPAAALVRIRKESQHGNFVQARNEARAIDAAWQSRPNSSWHWKFMLLDAEMLLLNGDTRQAESLIASPPPAEYSDLLPRYRMLQGYVAFRERRDSDAQSLLSTAAAAAHDSSDYELEADCQLLLAAYGTLENAEQTERTVEGILALGKAHDLRYQLVAALVDLGLLRIHQSRFAAAVPLFEEAARIAKQTDAALLYSVSLGNLATCYYNLGDFDKALELRKQAIAIQRPAGLTTLLRDSYLELGQSQLLQGQTQEAIDSLRSALALASEEDTPKIHSLIATNLAYALETTGALDEADQLTRRVIAKNKSLDSEARFNLSLNLAAIAEHRGEHEAATKAYLDVLATGKGTPSMEWSANAAVASIYAASNSVESNRLARQHFVSALSIIEQSRAEQLQSKYKITFLASLIHFYQEYVAFLMRSGDAAEGLRVADSSRASVLTKDVTGIEEGDNRGFISRIQTLARRGNITFLYYLLAPGQSWMWVVNDHQVQPIQLPDEREIADQVRSYRNLLEVEKTDPLRSSSALPSRLYQLLVAKAQPFITPGSAVEIIPDGVLHGLNFETLVVKEPAPHYWIQDVTISVAPSLGILTLRDKQKTQHNTSLLEIGDPVSASVNFSPIPHAGEEMQRVRSHFIADQTTVVSRADAVPAAYKSSLPQRFSTLHIAAHAESNERSPLDSAIILSPATDGFRLYAREIMELPLTADLVTLSACRSAGARTLSGEGPVGFAWAFFRAGAGNVVASLWEVDDRSTADLMNLFYSAIDRGNSYSEALRQAKLKMMQTSFPKPYFWAPFQIYSRRISPASRVNPAKMRNGSQ
jgi:CHAT domain-containing protein